MQVLLRRIPIIYRIMHWNAAILGDREGEQQLLQIRPTGFAVSPVDRDSLAPSTLSFFLGVFVFSRERDGRRIVMKFIKLKIEFSNDVLHDSQNQLVNFGIKQLVQCSADSIIVQLLKLIQAAES